MNWLNIFDQLEKADAEVYDRFSTRRRAMADFADMGKKVSMAALPLFVASAFKKAYGKEMDTPLEVLQYALYLEHLENEFYKLVKTTLPSFAGVPAAAAGAFNTIQSHEQQHVDFLTSTLTTLGATPKVLGTDFKIDITGGAGRMDGPFAVALASYGNVLLAAQMFEDTGVRAYKGRAAELVGNPSGALTAALRIHSVEARHAAHIRQMRKAAGADVDPWITGNSGDVPANFGVITATGAKIYAGEETSTQAGVSIVSAGIDMNQATESFDEPLTKMEVLAIVGTPGSGVGAPGTYGFLY